jgi:nitric oxide reductase subunit C
MTLVNLKKLVIVALSTSFLLYSFSLYSNLPVRQTKQDALSSKGKLLWQQYNCNSCHQVYGLGGYLGPDLTNVHSLKGASYIKAFLQSGTAIMPDFHLNNEEIAALIAYLKNIDASGKADPRSFTINKNGTIEQQAE